MKSHHLVKFFSLTVLASCTLFPLKAQSLSNFSAHNIWEMNRSQLVALISRTEFLASYPSGTILCFNDRSVESKVKIVEFNQSFQVVDFVYLDGAYEGQKGSADYSTVIVHSP
jgi:hypothetical protein